MQVSEHILEKLSFQKLVGNFDDVDHLFLKYDAYLYLSLQCGVGK